MKIQREGKNSLVYIFTAAQLKLYDFQVCVCVYECAQRVCVGALVVDIILYCIINACMMCACAPVCLYMCIRINTSIL